MFNPEHPYFGKVKLFIEVTTNERVAGLVYPRSHDVLLMQRGLKLHGGRNPKGLFSGNSSFNNLVYTPHKSKNDVSVVLQTLR